jgi:hypothetical protein
MIAGTPGIRKKKTITTPCMVKDLVVGLGLEHVALGVRSSRRIRPAKSPPIARKNVIVIRYRIAMRLVVQREEPALPRVVVVEVGLARFRRDMPLARHQCRRAAHGLLAPAGGFRDLM